MPRGVLSLHQGATGAEQIVGMALVTTTAENSVLTVRNPADNAAALTVAPGTAEPRASPPIS